MLQIKNLSLYLIEDLRMIVEDFTFSLNEEDKVCLVGEEGNGKSMILKAIYDANLLEDVCKIDGSIDKNNEIIGYLPQSIDDNILNITTKKYLENKIRFEYFDYNLYYKLLNEFGIDESLINYELYIKNLSGGERIKFYLLVELMKIPTILLLDEPSNDLDIESVNWLEKFMLNLNIPFIFVSHDVRLLKNVATKIIHLEQLMRRSEPKYTISNLDYESYVNSRENMINTQTKQHNKDKEEYQKKLQKFNKVHNSVETYLRATKSSDNGTGKRLKDKMSTLKSQEKRLEKEKQNIIEKPDFEESISFEFDECIKIPDGKTVLDFKLNELKAGDKILSKNIELKVIGAEKICIIGKNGAGKSTLIKEIMKSLKSLNYRVGYMPQTYFEISNFEGNAIEYLSDDFSKDEHTRISTYLGSLNFKREEMYRDIGSLSGGQKAKLFFAKMNLNRCEVLVLDEPTRNLSPLSQDEVIKSFNNYNGAIISVSHDRYFIENVSDKVYELDEDGLNLISG